MPTPRLGYIYLITNLSNGKGYIGQTRYCISTRWRQHIDAAGDGSQFAIHCAIRKYKPEQFSIREIARGFSDNLNDLEKCCIELFDTFALDGHGYNMTRGGEGICGWKMPPVTDEWRRKQREGKIGRKLSPETCAKLSVPKPHRRGEKRPPGTGKKIAAALRGKRLSDETRQKMRDAHKTRPPRPHSEETKRRISEGRKAFFRNRAMISSN